MAHWTNRRHFGIIEKIYLAIWLCNLFDRLHISTYTIVVYSTCRKYPNPACVDFIDLFSISIKSFDPFSANQLLNTIVVHRTNRRYSNPAFVDSRGQGGRVVIGNSGGESRPALERRQAARRRSIGGGGNSYNTHVAALT